MSTDYLDEEGYPTEECLQEIRDWDIREWRELMDHLAELWWHFDILWEIYDTPRAIFYTLHTGGWSGNEDLISAMHQAGGGVFWPMNWKASFAGGHYLFKVRKT